MIQVHSDISLEIVAKACDKVEKPEGFFLIDMEAKWVCLSEGRTSIFICEENTDKILCRADVNQDWSLAKITYIQNNHTAEVAVASFLCEVIFRNRIIFNNGIIIHASAVSWQGLGIIFTAPSETGKTTQAELWVKYMGAVVLNDDRPALRLESKRVYVHGTPWSGKRTLFLNECAPLAAIILLEQAQENRINRLPISKTVANIMPRCFLPYYDQKIMNKCLNALGEILTEVPVYRLECKPDREAVELVHQCLNAL